MQRKNLLRLSVLLVPIALCGANVRMAPVGRPMESSEQSEEIQVPRVRTRVQPRAVAAQPAPASEPASAPSAQPSAPAPSSPVRVLPARGYDHWTSDSPRTAPRLREAPRRSEGTGLRTGAGFSHGGRTRIVRRSEIPVPERHASVAGNTEIIRTIEHSQRVRVVPDRYYWHNAGGVRYCHTFQRGSHWYGFYHGPQFYWTRYHNSRWWWFDPSFDRWVYWANGYWWWPGPGGSLYIHVNNSYYPQDEAPVSVSAPAPVSLPEATGGSWTSPNGQRMVQIHGPQAEAFLYDKSAAEPVYLAYLGAGVEKVRFSGGSDGKPVRILVDFADGNFALFTDDGEALDLDPPATPPLPPPAAP